MHVVFIHVNQLNPCKIHNRAKDEENAKQKQIMNAIRLKIK